MFKPVNIEEFRIEYWRAVLRERDERQLRELLERRAKRKAKRMEMAKLMYQAQKKRDLKVPPKIRKLLRDADDVIERKRRHRSGFIDWPD